MSTIDTFLSTVKPNYTNEKPQGQDFSGTNTDAFSKVFESANKSVNANESRINQFSEKDLLNKPATIEANLYHNYNTEPAKEYDYSTDNKREFYNEKSNTENASNNEAVSANQQLMVNQNAVENTQKKPEKAKPVKEEKNSDETRKTEKTDKESKDKTEVTSKKDEIESKKPEINQSELENEMLKAKIQMATVAEVKPAVQNSTAKTTQRPNDEKANSNETKVAPSGNMQANSSTVTTKSVSKEKTAEIPTNQTNSSIVTTNPVLKEKTAEALTNQTKSQKAQSTQSIQESNVKAAETRPTKNDKQITAEIDNKIADSIKVQAQNSSQPEKTDLKKQEAAVEVTKLETGKQETPQVSDKKTKITEKMPEKNEKEDIRATVTKMEVQSDAKDSSGEKQNNDNAAQSGLKMNTDFTGELSAKNITINGTASFDKILETKQIKLSAENITNQVTNKLSELSTEKTQLTMSLTPENLGKVEIKLISERGAITAQITTENAQVKETLSKDMETLRQNLSEKGINVEKIAIQVQETNQTPSNNNNSQQQNSQKFDQTAQNFSNSNTDSNSSNQTSSQERSGRSSFNQAEITEEAKNIAVEDPKNTIQDGKVDLRI